MQKLSEDTKYAFESLPVPRAIAKFAIPTLLSQIITIIYNMADTFFVGHTNIPYEVAALAISFPIYMIITMIPANLFGVGANSFISRRLGAGERERAKKATGLTFYVALVSTVVLVLVYWAIRNPLIAAAGAKTPEAFASTSAYLRWTVTFGALPSTASQVMAHMLRAEGRTKQASRGLMLGGILNIFLDPIFVQGLGWGAAGAGFATCISNVCSLVFLLVVVLRAKDTVIDLAPAHICFDRLIAKELIPVGIPAALMVILATSANMVSTHFMGSYGDVTTAGGGIVQKLIIMAMQISMGITQGVTPLLGYNYGSGNYRRFRDISRVSVIILVIFSALYIGVCEIFPAQMIRLFTTESNTVALGVTFLRIWILCITGVVFTNMFVSIFQSMGRWKLGSILPLFRQLLLYIPLMVLFNHLFGVNGLMIAGVVSDNAALILGVVLYLIVMRQVTQSGEQTQAEV